MYNAIGTKSGFPKAMESLQVAKDMFNKGTGTELIFEKTGWYIDDLDGNW